MKSISTSMNNKMLMEYILIINLFVITNGLLHINNVYKKYNIFISRFGILENSSPVLLIFFGDK